MSLNPLTSYQPLDALADWLANEPLPEAFKRGAMQPGLDLTHVKRRHDRFNADFAVSAFTPERRNELMDEEREAERAQARHEELYGAEE